MTQQLIGSFQQGGGSISISPRMKRDIVLSWVEWVRAWNIFMPLVCSSRPAQDLPIKMAYHYEQVQQLYDTGKDWTYYDRKFRRLLASPEEVRGALDWGALHSESWLKANAARPQLTQKGPRPFTAGSSSESFVPKGFCFKFNTRKAFCAEQNCKYKHLCSRCSHGAHPMYRCSFRSFGRSFRGNARGGARPGPSPPSSKST